jgi:hypothetical protein
VNDAIRAEKMIKGWTRAKKFALIEPKNPRFEDLSATWRRQPDASVVEQSRGPQSTLGDSPSP